MAGRGEGPGAQKEVRVLTAGAQVRIENCGVREPFNGLMQISSGAFTKAVVLRK